MGIEDLPLWIQAVLIFSSQVGFIYFRTKNVYASSKLSRKDVFFSGIGTHIFWLLGVTIGVSAMLNGAYWLVFFSWSGGSLGADYALRRKISDNNKAK